MSVVGMIGKKIGMVSYYEQENAEQIPCTVIEVGPCYCVDVKTVERDGYKAAQLGFEQKKEKNTNKALLGHFKKKGLHPFRKLKEFGYDGEESPKIGDKITVTDVFHDGMFVDVTGYTKGRGFAGVVKRWNFGGGPATHGQSDRERAPGSLGRIGSNWRDVPKGKKMAGHYGMEKVTSMNLKVAKVLPEENAILVKGSIPGHKGSYVIVKRAAKKRYSPPGKTQKKEETAEKK